MQPTLPIRLSLADVQRHYNIPGHYLWRWHRNGCPALRRKLRAVRHPRHGRHLLYWRADVAKAAAAITPPVDDFDEAGERWVWSTAATRRYGITVPTLLRYRDRGCPLLPGKPKLRTRRRLVATIGTARLYERVYFRERDLEQITAARRGAKAHSYWMTRQELRDAGVPVSSTTLGRWQAYCLALGRRLKTKRNPRHRHHRLYWRPDIEAIKAAIIPACDEFEDAGGRWVWMERAADVYQLPPSTLDGWTRRGCPYLDGRKLKARVRLLSSDGAFKLVERRFLPEQDLKAIVAARPPGNHRPDHHFKAGQVSPIGLPGVSLAPSPAAVPGELTKILHRVINPSCTPSRAAKAVGRHVGTISRWCAERQDLIAARDDAGNVSQVYVNVLHCIAAEKSRRSSAARDEARMEKIPPMILAQRRRAAVALRA